MGGGVGEAGVEPHAQFQISRVVMNLGDLINQHPPPCFTDEETKE